MVLGALHKMVREMWKIAINGKKIFHSKCKQDQDLRDELLVGLVTLSDASMQSLL